MQSIQLTILKNYPSDRDLKIGEASIVRTTNGKKSLIMACPKCEENLSLNDHNIVWHDDNTITVEPSIVCKFPEKQSSNQILHDDGKCQGHFFIRKNMIEELG